MRVLQVITSGEHGGAQAHVVEVVTQLRHAGTDCAVACGPGGWLASALRDQVPVSELPTLGRAIAPWSDLRSLRRLVGLAKGAELVHTHSAKAGFLGRAAALLAGRPFVHTSHGSFLGEAMSPVRRAILTAAERLVARRTAHLFVLSRSDLDLLRRSGLYRNVPASVIRVSTERMRRPAGVWTPTAGSPTVIAVANLYPNKAIDLLISAFAEVRRQISDASLVVVGDGPERDRLVAQAENVPGGAIRFAGRMSDPSGLMLSCGVFTLSSRKEGVPLALLEALALGMPSVATAVGGVPEHVLGDEAILVVPDPDAIARGIIEVLGDPDRAAELGRRGRRAAERYVAAASIDPVVSAYREAIGARLNTYTRPT